MYSLVEIIFSVMKYNSTNILGQIISNQFQFNWNFHIKAAADPEFFSAPPPPPGGGRWWIKLFCFFWRGEWGRFLGILLHELNASILIFNLNPQIRALTKKRHMRSLVFQVFRIFNVSVVKFWIYFYNITPKNIYNYCSFLF